VINNNKVTEECDKIQNQVVEVLGNFLFGFPNPTYDFNLGFLSLC